MWRDHREGAVVEGSRVGGMMPHMEHWWQRSSHKSRAVNWWKEGVRDVSTAPSGLMMLTVLGERRRGWPAEWSQPRNDKPVAAEMVAGENLTVARSSRGKASLMARWRTLGKCSKCRSHVTKDGQWQCCVLRCQLQMWCISIGRRSVFDVMAEVVMWQMMELVE